MNATARSGSVCPSPLMIAVAAAMLAAPLGANEPELLNGTAIVSQKMTWAQFADSHRGAGAAKARSAADWLNGLRQTVPDKYHIQDERLYDTLVGRMRVMLPGWLARNEKEVVRLLRYNLHSREGPEGPLFPPRYRIRLVDCRVETSKAVPLMLWSLDLPVPTLHADALVSFGPEDLPGELRFRTVQEPGHATDMHLQGAPMPDQVLGMTLAVQALPDGRVELSLANLSSGIFAVYLVSDHAIGFYEAKGIPEFGRDSRVYKGGNLKTRVWSVVPGRVVRIKAGMTLQQLIRAHYRVSRGADVPPIQDAVISDNKGFGSVERDGSLRAGGVVVLPPLHYLGVALPGRSSPEPVGDPGYDGLESR